MPSRPSRSATPFLLIGLLAFVILFIAAFSSPGLQSLAAALFFVLAIGGPLWLR